MTLPLLLSFTIALAAFGPPVRVDHQHLPNKCYQSVMAIGPGAPSSQPIYVVFQSDTGMPVRSDILFQKSTDGGRTWLPTDLLIRRGERSASDPDITTDSDGNVYIVYRYVYPDTAGVHVAHILCTSSSDGGATWSSPVRVDDESDGGLIGLIRIVADTAGNLFAAWNQFPDGLSHVFTSVSTDKGATWSPRVCVDNDTLTNESSNPEVFVQPGTNHYLVASTTDRWFEGKPHIRPCAFLYRSTDCGKTFEPGVQLDTFNGAVDPHVVADRDHIICDYFGGGPNVPGDTIIAEARTHYTHGDSWGSPVAIANLDSLHRLYISGALVLSSDGRVHTALMVDDTALGYDIYYASSSDHGVSWSAIEPVYIDSAWSNWYPDIVADMAGYVYMVWSHGGGDSKIWFSTNNPAAISEETSNAELRAPNSSPTVVRNVLFLAERPSSSASTSSLLDISGREVLVLKPGTNDVRALAPGVYFVRSGPSAESRQPSAVTKVVVTR